MKIIKTVNVIYSGLPFNIFMNLITLIMKITNVYYILKNKDKHRKQLLLTFSHISCNEKVYISIIYSIYNLFYINMQLL